MENLTSGSLFFLKDLEEFMKNYANKTSIEDGRQAYEELAQKWGAPKEEMKEIKDFLIPPVYAPQAGEIPIRFYRPLPSSTPAPLLIYTHGGGWMRGSIESYDTKCRLMAKKLGWPVISVDYKRSPEFKFPTPLDQLQTVYEWCQKNADSLGIHKDLIVLSGDSGGGNITTGFTHRLRKSHKPLPKALLLFYPCLDMKVDSPSVKLYGEEGYFLTAERIRYYRDNYLTKPEDSSSPEASPLLATDLEGFPPTFMVTAGCDPLRSENEKFVEKLQKAHVTSSIKIYPGVLHAFTLFYKAFPEAEEAIKWGTGELLKQV